MLREKATHRKLGNTNIQGSGRRKDALEENSEGAAIKERKAPKR